MNGLLINMVTTPSQLESHNAAVSFSLGPPPDMQMAAVNFIIELEEPDQDAPSEPEALEAESTYETKKRAVEMAVKDLLDLDKHCRKYIDGQRKAILKTWIALGHGESSGESLIDEPFGSTKQVDAFPGKGTKVPVSLSARM